MKSLSHALTMGLIGAIAVFVSFSWHFPTWVLFIAWVSYYLLGKNIKSASLIFTQQLLGILFAIIIQYLGTLLSKTLGISGFSIVVFVIITGVYYLSKLKYLNVIPAYFLGMIIWFGSHTQPNTKVLGLTVFTMLLGFLFAWSNDLISERIDAFFTKKQ
ncbi:uncharacterized protein DUF1097 [Aquimarina sp. MAR_2010_214]|uniref:DUF1097 domain-containing protein n=1 Tax=Aquimarina sp. MAR_2010_214 TaxID=1250026 RepID=UPI000C70FA59|nr:DUF1097 domain-containing protein [Aquimarina sp. MAR_2010_214]PKV50649.1 uncharacterized protein DUF1097 [Aquimarina sp. MAR_2010_214]